MATVKELKEWLNQFPDDTRVNVLSTVDRESKIINIDLHYNRERPLKLGRSGLGWMYQSHDNKELLIFGEI
jgi:hypothetical protein